MKKLMNPPCFGIILPGRNLTNLDFPDNLALLSNKNELMQLMTVSLKNISKKVGLMISVNKANI